jgi:hypothetical protein
MRGRSGFSEGVVKVASRMGGIGSALVVHETEWGGYELQDVQAPNLRFWPYGVGDEELRAAALATYVDGEPALAGVGVEVGREFAAAMERWIAVGI